MPAPSVRRAAATVTGTLRCTFKTKRIRPLNRSLLQQFYSVHLLYLAMHHRLPPPAAPIAAGAPIGIRTSPSSSTRDPRANACSSDATSVCARGRWSGRLRFCFTCAPTLAARAPCRPSAPSRSPAWSTSRRPASRPRPPCTPPLAACSPYRPYCRP